MATNNGNGIKGSRVVGFTFLDVNIDFSKAKKFGTVGIYQGDDAVETTDENMTKICIQWLAFHDPAVLRGDDE